MGGVQKMVRNKIKICSDPYRKRMRYYWYEENGTWSDMEKMDNSPFNDDCFIHSSVSQKAYDIYRIIIDKRLYNPTVGISIVFEGTEDDFTDMYSVKETYFSEFDIELERGHRTLKTAKEVMPQVEKAYSNLNTFFNEYPDKETQGVIAQYTDAVNPEIAICVMGLYSSGKSAFINSLIGQEILPSDSDPATAKIYKIRESEEHTISFIFCDEEYRIEFCGMQWKANKNPNSDIVSLITKYLDEKSPKSEEQFMYWTLYALNNYAKKEGEKRNEELKKLAKEMLNAEELVEAKSDEQKIEKLIKKYRIRNLVKAGKLAANKLGDVIEVNISFVHSYLPLDKFKFVIYDTPGSNSVKFREHVDILKESLEQQTNGLPLFVTNPDSMDQTANEDIMEIIQELGGALDASNMMLVVNKSDEKQKKTLQQKVDKRDDLVVTKGKGNRVYFVSSIMGLGGKKNNPEDEKSWIDEDYYGAFFKNTDSFGNPNSKLYLRLFEYNMLPHDAEERMKERVKAVDEEKLLLWNSGIPCVEEEIGFFAQRHALYNKCSQAILYLTKAVESVEKSVENAEKEAQKLSGEREQELDDKKRELIQSLQTACDEKKKEFTSNFVNEITNGVVGKYSDEIRIKKVVEGAYLSCSGRKDADKLKPFNDKIENALRNDIVQYAKETSKKAKEYWNKCWDELRQALLQIVFDSDALTEEQKVLLRQEVDEIAKVPELHTILNISSKEKAVKEIIPVLWWKWSRIKIKRDEVARLYRESLKMDFARNNTVAGTENEKMFSDWIKQIKSDLIRVVSSLNPELTRLENELRKQRKIVEEKSKQRQVIQAELESIERLLEFEER